MATQGPNLVTAGAVQGTGHTWTNPGNVASSSVFATATIAIGDSGSTANLQGTAPGFSIPAGATINGITVSFVRKVANATELSANTSLGNGVQMLKAGVAAGSAKAGPGTLYTTSNVTETYGSGSDLWGTTWTPTDINASNFGFEISVDYDGSAETLSRNISIDNYLITVTYTAGGVRSSCSSMVCF